MRDTFSSGSQAKTQHRRHTTTTSRRWGNRASSAIPNLYRRGIHRKVSKADCYAPGGLQRYVSHPFFLLIVVIRPSLLFTASSPPRRLSRTHSAKGRKRGDGGYIDLIRSYFDPWYVEWGDILGENDIIRYLVFFLVCFVFTAIYRIKEVNVS